MNNKINFDIEYPDYKKFEKFLEEDYKSKVRHINPLNFFHPDKFLNKDEINSLAFFEAKPLEIPFFEIDKKGFNKTERFEIFTSKNEVGNISLWALSCLHYLSHQKSSLGKELEIKQHSNPRDGRLDVVVKDGKEIIILESKVSLFNMLSEKRFKFQVPDYYLESNKLAKGKYNISIFLLIGGEESDLYPPESVYCTTGKVGNISKTFYENLIKFNLKFISANALWALFAKSVKDNKKYFWRDILPKIFLEEGSVGLLSSGKVVLRKGKFVLEKLKI